MLVLLKGDCECGLGAKEMAKPYVPQAFLGARTESV